MMKRLSMDRLLAGRVLPPASVIVSAAPLLSIPNVVVAEGASPKDTDALALPTSFYGNATLDGATVAEGTAISAWVDGVLVAEVDTVV